MKFIDHALDAESFADELLSAPAEAFTQGWVRFEFQQALSERGRVAQRDEESGFPLNADFTSSIAIGGDDRLAGGEGLRQGAGQSFAQREVDEDIHDADEFGNGGWRNQPGENEVPLQAELSNHLLEATAPWTIADEQELDPGAAADQFGRSGEEIVVPLQLGEARYLSHHKIIGAQSKSGADAGVVAGLEKWFEREAAEDAGVLPGPPDACGEILLRHGVGDGDEVTRGAGGQTFCGSEDRVAQHSLKRTEGRAVNGVDDDGHASAPGGETSEHAGLAAVGVDEVGPAFAQQAGEFEQGERIVPGMDRTDEMPGEAQRAGAISEGGFERAFGSRGGAGDEIDLQARLTAESEDGGDRVFLRATNDQPGDDVGDAHRDGRLAVRGRPLRLA